MELFKLLGKIVIDSDQANKDMDGTTSKAEASSGKIASAFKKIGTVVVAAFAVDKIKDFGLACIESAAKVKAMNSQFEQVFGDLETSASESLSKIASETGILETRMKGSYTQIAAFAKTTGMETADALELSNRAMVAVADSAAYYDRSLEETTESLQSFLKGNFANDAALGLSCTETTRNAAANKLFGKSFKDLAEDQKQLTLLQMVEDANKLSGAMGQAARESDGWENVTGNLKESLNQLLAVIGAPILGAAVPVVKNLASAFTFLKDNIESVINGDMTLGEFGVKIIDNIQNAITTGIPTLMQSGAEILTNIGNGLKESIPGFASSALDVIISFTGAIKENTPYLLQSGLDLIVKWAEGIMAALPALIEKVPTIVSNIATTISENAPKLSVTALQLLKTLAIGLIKAIPALIESIPKILKALWDAFLAYDWLGLGAIIISKLKDGIMSMLSAIGNAAVSVKDKIVNKIKELPGALLTLGAAAITSLVSAVQAKVESVKTAAGNIKNAVVDGVKQLPSKMLEVGANLVQGLWNGISNAKDWVINKIKGFGDAILSEIKAFFGIHSPSHVMRDEVGQQLAAGIALGIEDRRKDVAKAAESVVGDTVAAALITSTMRSKAIVKKSAADVSAILVKNAKDRLADYKNNNELSIRDEVRYWDKIRHKCVAGSKARIEADKLYLKAKADFVAENEKIDTEMFAEAQKKLDNYKVYHSVSLADEKRYWDDIRQKFEEGTDTRISADTKYFEAKKQLDEKIVAAEKEFQDAIAETQKRLDDRAQSILSSFNLFEEFKTGDAVSGKTLMDSLASQVDALDSWESEISHLKSRMGDTDLFESIQAMGVKSLEQVKALNSMSESQLDRYEDLYQKRQKLAKKQAENELSDEMTKSVTDAYTKYKATCDELGVSVGKLNDIVPKSFDEMSQKLTGTTQDMKEKTEKNFKSILGTVSDSMQRVLATVASNMEKAEQKVMSAVDSMKEALASVGADTGGYSAGYSLGNVSAHAVGGILTEPTIFGYSPRAKTYHLGGEAGAEAIAPIDTLMGYVRAAVSEETAGATYYMQKLVSMLAEYMPQIMSNMGNDIVLDNGVLVGQLAPAMDESLGKLNRLRDRGR